MEKMLYRAVAMLLVGRRRSNGLHAISRYFLLACPVESHICSLNRLTLHELIKEYRGRDMFDRWRKAR